MTTTATAEEATARKPRTVGIKTRRRLSITFKTIIAILVAIYALVPVAFVVTAALNPLNTVSAASLIPQNMTLDHFASLFNDPVHPWPTWILNSVVVSAITSVVVVGLCALAAYSFSRFRFRGRRAGLISLVIIQLFPNLLAVVALFLLLQAVGNSVPESVNIPGLGNIALPRLGLNSLGGLILIYIGGALGFNTWLMKAYFDTVPYDLDESALVDGATYFQAFRWVVLPLVRPVLAVIGILTFIGTYSDFLLARVMLSSTPNYTLAVGLTLFIRGEFTRQWGVFAAAAVLGALPIMAIFLILQRQLIGGLSRGGVKG
jgi:arabinogalactan oligomer/maltooligosaccharide transport system permease protein